MRKNFFLYNFILIVLAFVYEIKLNFGIVALKSTYITCYIKFRIAFR